MSTIQFATTRIRAPLQEQGGHWSVLGDPTEGALIVAARKVGLESKCLAARLPRIAEVPFSSERKLMSTAHRDTGLPERRVVFTKGAPDVLLRLCAQEQVGGAAQTLTAERRAAILESNDGLARAALRTLEGPQLRADRDQRNPSPA